MGIHGDERWEIDSSYSEDQIASVLENIGVEIVGDTENDFLCLCPFHGNTDTPSFNVSKSHGSYICFNPACSVRGNFEELIIKIKKCNPFQAKRIILRAENEQKTPIAERIKEKLADNKEVPEYPSKILNRLHEDFWKYDAPQHYMKSRGFEKDTLELFKIGYSAKRNMITVPMYDPKGKPVGQIGRFCGDLKQFKNSPGLPKNLFPWNLNNAKRHGDTVIICESSFDAMRVHQAGYPNVVALLGGSISREQVSLLARSFERIVIFTDLDEKQFHKPHCGKCSGLCKGHRPGRELGRRIAELFKSQKVLWAFYEDGNIFPPGTKDAGDMTDSQIAQCIRNAVPNFQYLQLGLDR